MSVICFPFQFPPSHRFSPQSPCRKPQYRVCLPLVGSMPLRQSLRFLPTFTSHPGLFCLNVLVHILDLFEPIMPRGVWPMQTHPRKCGSKTFSAAFLHSALLLTP